MGNVGLRSGDCWVTWWGVLGYMVRAVVLYGGVLGYMVGSVDLPGDSPVKT